MDIICTVDFKKCLCIEHYLRWVTFTFQRDITEVIVATRHSPNKTHSSLTQQDTLATHPTRHTRHSPNTTPCKMWSNAILQRIIYWSLPSDYHRQRRNFVGMSRNKLTWAKLLTDLKNSFVTKLNLLKKCSFLRRKSLLDLYVKVILVSWRVLRDHHLGKLQ